VYPFLRGREPVLIFRPVDEQANSKRGRFRWPLAIQTKWLDPSNRVAEIHFRGRFSDEPLHDSESFEEIALARRVRAVQSGHLQQSERPLLNDILLMARILVGDHREGLSLGE
jgi:hypothetical protein